MTDTMEIADLVKRLSEEELDKLLRTLGRRVAANHPNMRYFAERFRDYELAMLNIKQLGYALAAGLSQKNLTRVIGSPPATRLPSKLCTQADIESDWFLFWCSELKVAPIYHRKLWELCYIAQSLFADGKLRPGMRGLGFGCGEEPLPSLFAKYNTRVTATDLNPNAEASRGWIASDQHASSMEKIQRIDICQDRVKLANIEHQWADMNDIPEVFHSQYDFCWSACAFEHLGSIEKGLQFVENSLKTLRSGGMAVHTTEFNLEDGETIDNWGTVLFQERHISALAERLVAKGYYVEPLDFSTGAGVLDGFVDVPPFAKSGRAEAVALLQPAQVHLKLSVDGMPCTSIALVIKVP
jgi:2-polyprenyl-3-methyl-5-hydroxy-6-metoxy-1,4-benzoquinol methylase